VECARVVGGGVTGVATRYLFIFGPHGRLALRYAEAALIRMNLERLFVFYCVEEQRPFTEEEVEAAMRKPE
jgi:hypothetical protein